MRVSWAFCRFSYPLVPKNAITATVISTIAEPMYNEIFPLMLSRNVLMRVRIACPPDPTSPLRHRLPGERFHLILPASPYYFETEPLSWGHNACCAGGKRYNVAWCFLEKFATGDRNERKPPFF